MLRFTKGSVINLPGLCMCDEKDVIHDNLMPQLAARQWKSLSYTQKKPHPDSQRLQQLTSIFCKLLKRNIFGVFFCCCCCHFKLGPKKMVAKEQSWWFIQWINELQKLLNFSQHYQSSGRATEVPFVGRWHSCSPLTCIPCSFGGGPTVIVGIAHKQLHPISITLLDVNSPLMSNIDIGCP